MRTKPFLFIPYILIFTAPGLAPELVETGEAKSAPVVISNWVDPQKIFG
jgi:hypothetical protein